MKLPNYEQATIAEKKVTQYLLNLNHPDDPSKAEFFIKIFGFSIANWKIFVQVLKQHAATCDVVNIRETKTGVSYAVEGEMESPTGQRRNVRSVWQIDFDKNYPRLITAYPLMRRK